MEGQTQEVQPIFLEQFLGWTSFKRGPFQPMKLSKNRDDCFDIELDKTEAEINTFTEFLNGLVPGIKLKENIRSDRIEFLDTTVAIKDGYLITSPYSKLTDSKQYLLPSTIHKSSVVEKKVRGWGDYVQRYDFCWVFGWIQSLHGSKRIQKKKYTKSFCRNCKPKTKRCTKKSGKKKNEMERTPYIFHQTARTSISRY